MYHVEILFFLRLAHRLSLISYYQIMSSCLEQYKNVAV